jgi:hypothetical protein
MERLSTEELHAIKERAEKATAGPWNHYPIVDSDEFVVIGADIVAETVYEITDATFLAHAHEDVPKLITEIERLREELARYDKILRGPVDIVATDEYGREVKFHGFKLNMPDGDTE